MIRDVSNAEYHGDRSFLSSSSLKMLIKNPQEFYELYILKIQKEKEDKGFFDEGSYMHSMILEPDRVSIDFKVFDGFVRRGEAWEAFKASLTPGQIGISKPQHLKVMGWLGAYKKNEIAVKLLEGCKTEHSLFTSLSDVPIKVRADAINVEESYIVDVKTSGFDTTVDGFKFAMDQFGYSLSASLYCQAFEAYYGKPFSFYFIVIGKKDSVCEVFKLGEESRRKGDQEVYTALSTYKKCVETNVWTLHKKHDKIGEYEVLEV